MILKPVSQRSFTVKIEGYEDHYFTTSSSPELTREVTQVATGYGEVPVIIQGSISPSEIEISKAYEPGKDEALVSLIKTKGTHTIRITPVSFCDNNAPLGNTITLLNAVCNTVALPSVDAESSDKAEIMLTFTYTDVTVS